MGAADCAFRGVEGALYGFTADHFTCLDLATGQPLWREEGSGTALLIGDKCLRLRSRGDLIIGRLSPQGFAELQTASFGMTEIKNAPASANGRLIARNEKGHVVCLQIDAEDDTPHAAGSTLHGMWTAPWEWYAPWNSIDGRAVVESATGAMKTLIEGLFPKERRLD